MGGEAFPQSTPKPPERSPLKTPDDKTLSFLGSFSKIYIYNTFINIFFILSFCHKNKKYNNI
jgi:hypothetical protein